MINISEEYKTSNKMIVDFFEASYSQKYIAALFGLSESRVKKIIAEMRKK